MITTDRNDPRLPRKHSPDESPVDQQEVYWVLPEEERAKGFVRPYRESYRHLTCGGVTRMARPIAETYARDIRIYTDTFCVRCSMHRPIGEFVWEPDGSRLGT